MGKCSTSHAVHVCKSVLNASFGVRIITHGDIPNMTNERSLGARCVAHLSQDGR